MILLGFQYRDHEPYDIYEQIIQFGVESNLGYLWSLIIYFQK